MGRIRIRGEDAGDTSGDESEDDSVKSDATDSSSEESGDDSVNRCVRPIWKVGCLCSLQNFCELYRRVLKVEWKPEIQ